MHKPLTYHRWTRKEEKFLRENFQEFSCKELAHKIGVTEAAIKKKRQEFGLVKTPEALQKIYARLTPNSGQFKPGTVPGNTLYDNCITMRIDQRGFIYKWIRLSLAKWEMLHVHLWKKAGKEIPDGYVLRFKDGNTLNCVLQNLVLFPKYQHLQINRNAYFENNDRKYPVPFQKKIRDKQLQAEAKLKTRAAKKVRRSLVKTSASSAKKAKEIFVAPKRQEKVLPTRKIDLSKCIPVKIDNKTVIYVKPGTDIEKIKSKFKRA